MKTKSIYKLLRDSATNGYLQEVTRHQVVDIDDVFLQLKEMNSSRERIEIFKKKYPCLYIFILSSNRKRVALTRYMEECKKEEDDFLNYTLYIHGYLLPWLEELRKRGRIKKGNSSVQYYFF